MPKVIIMAKKKSKKGRQENIMFFEEEKVIKDTSLEIEANAEPLFIEEVEDTVETVPNEEIVVDTPVVETAVEEEIVEEKAEKEEEACTHDFETLAGGVHKVIKGIPHYYKKFKCKKCGKIVEKRV